jgi:prevent-host-death family protein
MPIIKPISDLRNKSNEISDLARKTHEPVFITRNGKGDMVVMSMAKYGQIQIQIDLVNKLAAAQAEFMHGDRGRSLTSVVNDLRAKINERAKV